MKDKHTMFSECKHDCDMFLKGLFVVFTYFKCVFTVTSFTELHTPTGLISDSECERPPEVYVNVPQSL